MNALLLLVLFAGVILVMANELVNSRRAPTVVYRYLPRDLDTYLREEPLGAYDQLFTTDLPDQR